MKGQYKIVFAGPVGAGKTTAIAAISDIPPVSTEQKATDETKNKKPMTTVAMDYGSIRLPGGELINLYGTPGQQRFDFMWDIVSVGAIGLIVMIDHSVAEALSDLNDFIEAFRCKFDQHQIVVGINKYAAGTGRSLADYHAFLAGKGLLIPVLEVDARDRADVVMLVQALLYNIDPALEGLNSQ